MRITIQQCDQDDEHILIRMTRDEAELLRDDLPDADFVENGFSAPMYRLFTGRLKQALDPSTVEAPHAR